MALLTGCSTAPELVAFDNSRTYGKSREDVWLQLMAFFKSSSIPVKTSNKANGIVVAMRNLKRASIYADCGTSDVASVGDGTLTVKISLKSLGAQKTRATVDVTFTAYRHFVGLTKTRIKCFSNGTLETEILKNL